MNQKETRYKFPAKTVLFYLIVVCLIVGGVTLSRYTESLASNSDTARVAKWKHDWGEIYPANFYASTYKLSSSSVSNKTQTQEIKFELQNNSEVTAKYTPYIYYYDTDDSTIRSVTDSDKVLDDIATITYTCAGGTKVSGTVKTYLAQPGDKLSFTAKISNFTADSGNGTYRCRAYILAEQVD